MTEKMVAVEDDGDDKTIDLSLKSTDMSKAFEGLDSTDEDDDPDEIAALEEEERKLNEGNDDDSTAADEAGTDEDDKSGTDDDNKDDDKTGDDKDDDIPAEDDSLATENRELKTALREQQRQFRIVQAKLDRVAKKQDRDPDDDEDDDADTLSSIEVMQNDLDEIATARGTAFEEMVEMMSLSNKFEDVREVCTQARFADVFEEAARQTVKTAGGDLTETQMKLELSVWQMPNPYRYMYGLIKEYHPDFAKPAENKDDDTAAPGKGVKGKKPTEDAKKRGKELKKTPSSVMDIPGGKATAGWTAERIDNLPEHDLGKVPADVYEAYLRGELDN